jgi:hypothetical protein
MNVSCFLRISYGHLSSEDGSEVGPSLVVKELLHRLGDRSSDVLFPSFTKKERSLSFEKRFSFRLPEVPLVTSDLVLSLSDLSSFAKHPWRYYLQKEHRIFLKDFSPSSFSMKKASLLKTSLLGFFETKLEETLDPSFGLFEEAFSFDAKEKQKEIEPFLETWGKAQKISFLRTCFQKTLEKKHLQLPPIQWQEDGFLIQIIGDVIALEKGALSLGEDSFTSLIRIWPEVLASLVGLGVDQICFLKTGKTKSLNSPFEALKQFTRYYLRCHKSLSPLISDWADGLLRKKEDFYPSSARYEDVYVDWLLERLDLPSFSQLQEEWSSLKETFAEILLLYPSRASSKNLLGNPCKDLIV